MSIFDRLKNKEKPNNSSKYYDMLNTQNDIDDIRKQREKFKQLNNKYKQTIKTNTYKQKDKLKEAAEYILAVLNEVEKNNNSINIESKNIELYIKGLEFDKNIEKIVKNCWKIAKNDIKETISKNINKYYQNESLDKIYKLALNLLSQVAVKKCSKKDAISIEFWINTNKDPKNKQFFNDSALSIAYHYQNDTGKYLKVHSTIN